MSAPTDDATADTAEATSEPEKSVEAVKRARRTTLFPASTFEDALELAVAIYKMGAGQPVRRVTLLDELGKSPSSGPTRQWITNSSKYGLTVGSYKADMLSLTDDGLRVVGDGVNARDRARATFDLAIAHVDVFKQLYDTHIDNRLPVQAVLVDKVRELGIPEQDAVACVDTFTVNAKYVGVLRSISGAERFITLDTLVADYLKEDAADRREAPKGREAAITSTPKNPEATPVQQGASSDFDNVCFYITPIGSDDSEARRHADLFMGSLVEPALAEFDLTVVRADQIGEAGMITRQIIEYILHSKLVIADLSFHNPNVFYELALRHAVRKPIVQISRQADRLPFDIGQVRTVVIDTTDIYTLVPQLASLQAQIASQIRATLEEGTEVENPLSVFAPTFWTHLPSN